MTNQNKYVYLINLLFAASKALEKQPPASHWLAGGCQKATENLKLSLSTSFRISFQLIVF
jgi:hypothetical protein